MTKMLTPKVQASGFVDLVLIGIAKNLEERLTTPYIGNATLVSGAIKGIVGGIIDGKGGKAGKIISSAFAVDAGEDLAIGILGLVGGAGLGIPGLGVGGAGRNEWA